MFDLVMSCTRVSGWVRDRNYIVVVTLVYESSIYGTYLTVTYIGMTLSIDPKYQQDIPADIQLLNHHDPKNNP